MESQLNDIGKKFNYKKKEILFDRFIGWFDNTTFILDNDKFMGWGEYESSCGNFRIGTACFEGGEWLDTVECRTKANNPYNNYVNAIAYWDLMNNKGKDFYLKFYHQEFFLLRYNINSKIADLQEQITRLNKKLLDIDTEIETLTIF